MTFFLKFHVWLIKSNKTTIENLEKKGQNFKSIYDIGPDNNWYQVFGTNKLLWPFPVFMGSGKPLGDGIYWANNQEEKKVVNNSPGNKRGSLVSPVRGSTATPGS